MARTVITISRTLGAGGEELGQALATDLGYRYVDAQIIHAAAEQAGVSEESMAAIEKRQSLIERILNRMASGAIVTGAMVEPLEYADNTTDAYQRLIIQVVRDTAAEGSVVLVAHGAAMALGASDRVLRVLVTAPLPVRTARVATTDGVDAKQAEKRVAESDNARAQFFQRFYNLGKELDTSYDLVVNTETLDLGIAAKAIAAIARGRELAAV